MAPGLPTAMDRPHFIGIGGAGMSGIAKILAQRGAKVAGSDAKDSGDRRGAARARARPCTSGTPAEHLADRRHLRRRLLRDPRRQPGAGPRRRARHPGRPPLGRARPPDGRPASDRGRRHPRQDDHHLDAGRLPVGAGPEPLVRHRRRPRRARAPTPSTARARSSSPRPTRATAASTSTPPRSRSSSTWSWTTTPTTPRWTRSTSPSRPSSGKIVPGGTLVIAADQRGRARADRARPRSVDSRRSSRTASPRTPTSGSYKVTPRGLTSEVTVVLDGRILTFTVSVPGRHYAHNAVAALAAGVALGVPAHNLASALGKYTGVKRRLQLKGEAAGVQVIDSYAHHPTEMTADLEAMRAAAGGRPASWSSSSRTSSPAPRSWARRWARPWPSPTPRWSWTSTRPARTRSRASPAR